MNRFADKVVWITGASSGIGRALALELAEQGADVAVSGRREERLAEVVAEIEDRGRRARAVVCDVTEEEQVARAADRVARELGRMDVAIANAGLSVSGTIESLSAADWRRQLDTNVIGLALTARYALPHLRETAGRLVLVGSVTSMVASPKSGAYSASKHAVRAIGATLSLELHGTGVTCTTLHPGFVESEIAQVDNEGTFHPEREDRRPRRLMWPTDRAAAVMARAIDRRKRELVFTKHGKLAGFLGRHAPALVHLAQRRQR